MLHPSRREVVEGLLALAWSYQSGPAWGFAGADSTFRRGINVWPWFALTREFPPPRRDFGWPPFATGRPRPTTNDLVALRKSGFDFIRLPIDPGPLLALPGHERNQIMAEIERAINSSLAADLSVVLDLHPNEATHFWTGKQLLDEGPEGSFDHFTELVVIAAQLLKRAPSDRVALELINEPPLACDAPRWQSQQKHLLAAARNVDSHMTIVLTGACGSLPDGLLALVPPEPRDDNVLYTFHYYKPYLFSHQGAIWMRRNPIYRYLRDVPWPASSGRLESSEAAFRAQVAADTSLSDNQREGLIGMARLALTKYFEENADRSYIERHFFRIAEWREAHNIPANRILLGEFGATKYAPANDRARYLHDVRSSAETQGFSWAMWNLFDTMGLTLDDSSRVLDREIVGALGLTGPE
jgi:hypothetical protein